MFIQLAGNPAQVCSLHLPVEHVIGINVRLSFIIQPILSVFVVNHYVLFVFNAPSRAVSAL